MHQQPGRQLEPDPEGGLSGGDPARLPDHLEPDQHVHRLAGGDPVRAVVRVPLAARSVPRATLAPGRGR